MLGLPSPGKTAAAKNASPDLRRSWDSSQPELVNPEAAEGEQSKPGGFIAATYRSVIFVEEEMDSLCSVDSGEATSWGAEREVKGKAETNLKVSSNINSPACAMRLMRRLFRSLQRCCCIVASANSF